MFAVAELLGIAAGFVEVWLTLELAVLPEISVGPLETAVVIEFRVSNPGHPNSAASPNACSFASCSSSLGVVAEVCAGSSIDVLPSDDPCSHSSSLTVYLYKRMGPFDSRPNRHHNAVSDTSALPMNATTSHCRKRCPLPSQGQHRHKSQVSLRPLEVRQIRWVGAEKC